MAKTKAKRRRKHRGTQAGTITPAAESRTRGGKGGGGRPRDRSASREDARRRRADRLDKPPTWRGAINRAAIAAVIVAGLAVLALGNTVPQALVLAAVMLLIYIPLGFGFDTLVYRFRQRRKPGGASPPATKKRPGGRGAGDR